MLKMGPFSYSKRGKIYVGVTEDERTPFLINDKEVYLPTKHALRTPVKDREIFHPFRENIMTGPPATIIAFRNVIVSTFNTVYFQTFIQTLRNAQEAGSYGVKVGSILSLYPKLTNADVTNIMHMCKDFNVLDIQLHHVKGGKVNAVITSPLLNEIHAILDDANNQRVFDDHKVSLKSLKSLKDILNELFGFKDSYEAAISTFEATGTQAKSAEVITSAIGSVLIGMSDEMLMLRKYKTSDIIIPSMDFFRYEVFSDQKALGKLIKEVVTNGSIAKKIKKKKKKGKKKKKKLKNVASNGYGIVQPNPLDTMDPELAALYATGALTMPQVGGTYLPTPGAPQQAVNPYLTTAPQAVDQYGIPIPQTTTPGYGVPATPAQPTYGRFGWR